MRSISSASSNRRGLSRVSLSADARAGTSIPGEAIECRMNAESSADFSPSPGRVSEYHAPGGLGVRVDSALYQGYEVPPFYDSLIGKLVVHDDSREDCVMRLRRALAEYVVGGIETTIPLHQRLVDDPEFRRGAYDIHWLEPFLAPSGWGSMAPNNGLVGRV